MIVAEGARQKWMETQFGKALIQEWIDKNAYRNIVIYAGDRL